MKPEFSGIERRLEKLSVCLQKLEPFKKQKREELLGDPYPVKAVRKKECLNARNASEYHSLKYLLNNEYSNHRWCPSAVY